MSLHIHRFVDLIKATEARGQKDLHMPLRDAKDLHGDITKLLVTLEELRTHRARPAEDANIEVVMDGGSFKNP
jgi:hypothetical protein